LLKKIPLHISFNYCSEKKPKVGACLTLEVVWALNGKNNVPAAVGNRTPEFHPTRSRSELRLKSWWSPFLGISAGVDRISLLTWKGSVF